MLARHAVVSFVGGLVLLASACGVASIPPPSPGDDNLGLKSPVALGGACGPSVELAPTDPATFPKCACKDGGKARCVPSAKMPAVLANQLEKCDEDQGACVPDTLIASGGKAPPTCAAKGKPGRCFSMCVPLVAKYAATYLTRGDGDSCPADERCVPCENPLDGTSTGVCDIGEASARSAACDADGGVGGGIAVAPGEAITCPFSGTPADPSRFPACGTGGRCVEAGLVTDPRIAARLAPCNGGLCVPEIYVKEKGQHLPKSCSSFAGIEGRCFSTVFRDVAEAGELLVRDACGGDERCVPCWNPATGAPTGACETVSCDKPKAPAKVLADCCKTRGAGRGKCVPRSDVPPSFQQRLDDKECNDATELCVPNDNLDPNVKPIACASGNGRGVCVSNCVEFDFLESIFLDQGSCRSDQTCVPCRDPSGQPTNLPGCSGT